MPAPPGRDKWEVFTHGGRHPAGLDAVEWCQQAASLGAGEILLTSMDRDGTGKGFDGDLLRAVCAAVRVPVVASGGVGELHHFVEGAQAGATGLLAASVFHFGKFSIAEVKSTLHAAGLPVRFDPLRCIRNPMPKKPSKPPPRTQEASPSQAHGQAEDEAEAKLDAQSRLPSLGRYLAAAAVLDRLCSRYPGASQRRPGGEPFGPAACPAAWPRSPRNSARRRSNA